MRVDPLELELASDLVDLVDPRAGGDLLDRVKALRRKIALEIGIVIPLVRTRDNLDLPPETYAIRLIGVEVARGEAPRRHRARHRRRPRTAPRRADPRAGLRAGRQVGPGRAARPGRDGRRHRRRPRVGHHHAPRRGRPPARRRLLGREDVKLLIDVVKRTHPVVVEELTPALLSLGEVQRVLQALLDEGVSIRDLVRIFEALSLRAQATRPRRAGRGRARRARPGDRGAVPRRRRGAR